jgi:Oxaloacetate decarboxylase, gamma chain.
MSVAESLLIALFCMTVVFLTLILLWGLIRAFTFVISILLTNRREAPAAVDEKIQQEPEVSAGELKLYNVDERTAAMIMAIVSDETGIPLSELCFHSIKALNAEKGKNP